MNASAAVAAGYEIRWWSSDQDHQAADLFVFAAPRESARFISQAASPRCRQRAVAYRLAQPAGARALIWTNPDGAREADVFFARGVRAFRLVDVPPPTYLQGPFRFDNQELIAASQLIACRLRQAHCKLPPVGSAFSPAGDDALRILLAAESRVRSLPQASELLNPACDGIRLFRDPQASLLYESCQATLHYLGAAVYALRCYRAGPCRQWAIETAAADSHRLATIDRQLAAQLSSGKCRAAWNRDASADDQLGQMFQLLGHALAARDPSARRLERQRAALLEGEAERTGVGSLVLLDACAPHGGSLALPEIT